jgi:hypothetical protein
MPKSDKVIVVELSPFLNCTGPALFKWDNDGELLRNGPFTFRLNSYHRPHLEEIVETNWEHRWNEKVPPYWEFYTKAKPDEDSASSSDILLLLSFSILPSHPPFLLIIPRHHRSTHTIF